MTPPNMPPEIFDRALLRLRRQRAWRGAPVTFLHDLILDDIVDRLETIQRRFETAVIIGPGATLLRPKLTPACDVGALTELSITGEAGAVFADEDQLPLAPQSCNLVISLMGLHMTNDLPGALLQMRRALKPDGLLLAALPGEKTLQELRSSLHKAEAEILGGVSPRVAPMAAIKDLGGLLQRVGLALPVADMFSQKVTYRDPITLLKELRQMGESNVLFSRRKSSLRRDVLMKALEFYREDFPAKTHDGVEATFDILMLTGWAPHESQQKPMKPGSAKASLREAVLKA